MDTSLPPNENKGPLILGVVWSFTGLDIIIVALRFYNRSRHGGIGWDDWSILMACLITTFGSVCNTFMVANNWGRHIQYLSKEQLSHALEWVTFAELQAYIAVYFVKISVCFFVLRMLKTTHRKTQWAVYVLMAILTIITIVAVVFLCISCIPLRGIWTLDPNFPKKCLSEQIQTKITRAQGTIGVVTDFACVIIPLSVIRQLNMNTRQKVGISLLIALGLFSAACSIGKTVTTTFAKNDPSWEYTPVLIWAGLETNAAIAVASIPAIRQLFQGFVSSKLDPRNYQQTYIYRATTKVISPKRTWFSDATVSTTTGDYDRDTIQLKDKGVMQTQSFTIESRRASEHSLSA